MTPSASAPLVAIAMLSTVTGGGIQPASHPYVIFRNSRSETPLPFELWPGSSFLQATGQTIAHPVARLAMEAQQLVRTLAFLPVDPEAERRVDAWLAEREPKRTAQPIVRHALRQENDPG